jgi:hypothetical protein
MKETRNYKQPSWEQKGDGMSPRPAAITHNPGKATKYKSYWMNCVNKLSLVEDLSTHTGVLGYYQTQKWNNKRIILMGRLPLMKPGFKHKRTRTNVTFNESVTIFLLTKIETGSR